MISAHKRQGLKLDTWLNRHQILTLTFELEEHSIVSVTILIAFKLALTFSLYFHQTFFNYEKIGLLERRFDDLQEKLEDSINGLLKKQNDHKMAMAKLLDMMNEVIVRGLRL